MKIERHIHLLLFFLGLCGSVFCGEDFYKLLGIQRGASDKEIRKAFKKLAVTMHPDKNPVSMVLFFFHYTFSLNL